MSIQHIKTILFVFIFVSEACKEDTASKYVAPSDTVGDTLTIVRKFCGISCHLFPEPSLLDKSTWAKQVLPNMGSRLGIKTEGYNPYGFYGMEEIAEMVKRNIYPEFPLISKKDWSKILDYFDTYSPDSIQVPKIETTDLNQFQVIPFGDKVERPRITMLSFDSIDRKVNIGLESGLLYSFNPDMSLADTISLSQTPMDILYHEDGTYILSVANMYPSEIHGGKIIKIDKNKNKSIVIENLHRPVHFDSYAIQSQNNLIISEFGFETGSLSIYKFDGESYFKKTDLIQQSGSVKTHMADLDGDSIPELIALIAQGQERILVFKQNDKGLSDPITVLKFLPVHGVCDIDIADMNKDGNLDLIISNGDNADYSIMTKPFHGITIYLNQGNLQFSPFVFIPYPSILHSELADFDLDGDIDIASTAFFSHNMKQRFPAFIYFENAGIKFVPATFPQSNFGKWMTIEKADIDRDGDQDLFIGSFLLNNYLVEGNREDLKKYSLLLLKNKIN